VKARVAVVTLAVLISACHGSKPKQAPTPVATTPPPPDSSTSTALANIPLDTTTPDVVRVAQRDLTHEAVKIFGDSVATAPAAAAEPT